MEPTNVEIKLRHYLVHRIRLAITEKWPEASVDVFGSFSTDLYLPNSDIDIVVQFPPSTQVRLRRIASCLEAEEICRDPQIIEHASVTYLSSLYIKESMVTEKTNIILLFKVPVIKFEDVMTKLKVDIILNSTSGIDSANMIQSMIQEYPGVRPLALIVKYLLSLRHMNEVFTGGLGGYAVVCLVVSFLQVK